MSSLLLVRSAIWLEITQSSPFTMLWFVLWSHLRVHNLDFLDESKCYRECSTDLLLLGYYYVLMQAQ